MKSFKIVGKKKARFWICCLLSYFGSLTKIFWRGQWGHTPFWPPGWRHSKWRFCPFWGRKISKFQKIFFFKTAFLCGQLMVLMTFFCQVYHFGSIAILSFGLESWTRTLKWVLCQDGWAQVQNFFVRWTPILGSIDDTIKPKLGRRNLYLWINLLLNLYS